ncbi:MAG: stage II sporulation protein R [Clostridia bacterium]|nr:stage II sporulation protein R [Clostridia bacterium]
MDHKYILTILLAVAIFSSILFLPAPNTHPTLEAEDYFRMHIRANSNSQVDQNIKYSVRDSVVETLTPILSNVESKAQAMSLLEQNLYLVEDTANQVLSKAGFDYSASASIHTELFPTRTYDNVTLVSGVYDSLIINLGTGKGDNWWCVVYPPLCFVGTDNQNSNIIYRSRLLEIINNFYGG